ncbi:Actin-Binding Lim Protein 3 [Manis pentadactyla]|nr:Actin-Binding Lim Protein 3 [Manis pentadactyla]
MQDPGEDCEKKRREESPPAYLDAPTGKKTGTHTAMLREEPQADNRKNVYLCVRETGLHSLLTPRLSAGAPNRAVDRESQEIAKGKDSEAGAHSKPQEREGPE